MTPTDYAREVERTSSSEFDHEGVFPSILHASLGVMSEAGELADIVKKAQFGEKAPDLDHLDEEFGDILWYVTLYALYRGTTLEELMEKNVAKLRVRYPSGFDPSKMEESGRDRAAEAAAMKGVVPQTESHPSPLNAREAPVIGVDPASADGGYIAVRCGQCNFSEQIPSTFPSLDAWKCPKCNPMTFRGAT